MPGRRVQRNVRVTVAGVLLAISAALVIAAVAASTAVDGAAIVSVVCGALAARMVHTEVIQTRRDASRGRAAQARDFVAIVARLRTEHSASTDALASRLAQRDSTIDELNGTIRLAEKRIDVAEAHGRREAQRADDAQARLTQLLDQVLAQQVAGVLDEQAGDDLPTVIDLFAWEDRAAASVADPARRHA